MNAHLRIVAIKMKCFFVRNYRLKYAANNVNSVYCGEEFYRWGRMQIRPCHHILGQIEELTNKQVSSRERQFILHGPEEVDLVHSGLEETMVTATREIMEEWKRNPQIPDMRTAAYVVAINKVGTSYAELGIFP